MTKSGPGYNNYDLRPATTLSEGHPIWCGPAAIARLGEGLSRGVVVVDTYPGTDLSALMQAISAAYPDADVVDVEQAAKPEAERDVLLDYFVTDDRLFGRLCHFPLADLYDAAALEKIAATIDPNRLTFLVGWGASLVDAASARLVLGDMARWEIQTRQRAGAPNWQSSNFEEDALRKYKRSFFVEWRTADDHKQSIWEHADLWLDTNQPDNPKVITADAAWEGMRATSVRPFRVVPYFDPGSWGGQWMRSVFGLDDKPANFAWSFDCVPEENSLLLRVGGIDFEMPSINLVLRHPDDLLGCRTRARFGSEFPIRFDLLDTMDGGNLSLQVHPLTQYIREQFGMPYTQDESYYLLDAGPDAEVYLGLLEGVDPDAMIDQLWDAQAGGPSFDARQFVNTFPAHKHDHFSIPAGTVHCSGANSVVLEISATPFIFTFKMWDWDRLGLDGLPRPINISHAEKNIQWHRDTQWVHENLLDQVKPIGAGEGWREERTGLHELEFIETRRHWISGTCPMDTHGTVHVKNLVEGAEAIIESPTGSFDPFVVHYAESFIIPASVGPYTVRPHGLSEGREVATITAWVRGTTSPMPLGEG